MYKILFIIIALFLIMLAVSKCKFTEGFANTPVAITSDNVADYIYTVYKADVKAIQNLADIAMKLQAGGITVPGSMTILNQLNVTNDTNLSGKLNVSGSIIAGETTINDDRGGSRFNKHVTIGTTNAASDVRFPLEITTTPLYWSVGEQYITGRLALSNGNIDTGWSIRTSGAIWAQGFMAASDKRIKTNIQNAKSYSVLEKILQMPLMTYDYIDKHTEDKYNVYGLIAQDVKKILPEAIKLSYNYIPSIYKTSSNIKLTQDNMNVIIDIIIYNTSDIQVGRNIKLVIENIGEYNTKIVSFTSNELIVPKWNNFNITNKVFVYGPEVDDFHTLDKPYLGILCIGGIQELNKQNNELKARIEKLEQLLTK